jgi:hypothetical protein
MIDRKDPLPVTRQCALLDLARSTFYHVRKPVSDEELELMTPIGRCHTDARASLGRYFHFYNTERRRQSLDRRTPGRSLAQGSDDAQITR